MKFFLYISMAFAYIYLILSGDVKDASISLSTGLLISILIWLITVEFPESKRKQVIVNNLKDSDQYFRCRTIRLLLNASGGYHDESQVESLCDFKVFRDHFNSSHHQEWYKALNGIQENETLLNDLIMEMDIFLDELRYVVNNLKISDKRIYIFYSAFKENLYRLKKDSNFLDDPTKYLGRFLYEHLANFSFMKGPLRTNYFEDIFSKI